MSNGFSAGACKIDVGAEIGGKDGKCGGWEAFWGAVDVIGMGRGGSGKEYGLIEYERG